MVCYAVPALLFSSLSKAPVEELGNIKFIMIATGSTLFIFLLSMLLSMLIKGHGMAVASMRAAAAAYSNAGYMGVPLAIGVPGSKAAIPATLIVCF